MQNRDFKWEPEYDTENGEWYIRKLIYMCPPDEFGSFDSEESAQVECAKRNSDENSLRTSLENSLRTSLENSLGNSLGTSLENSLGNSPAGRYKDSSGKGWNQLS